MVLQKDNIKLKKEFDLVYRKGKNLSGRFFILRVFFQKDSQEKTRFGVVVSLKVSNKAVVRNRKRRQLKEIIRLSQKRINPGYLCLITAKKEIVDIEYDDLNKEFIYLCKKAGILKQ